MLGNEPSKVSLVSVSGHFIKDLTKYLKTGTYTRTLNETSIFEGEISVDRECANIFQNIRPWAHFIRCERDNRDQWDGPITNLSENKGNINITASDRTALWARETARDAQYRTLDVASIAEDLIDRVYAKRLYGSPVVYKQTVGLPLSKTYSETEDYLLSDAIADLPLLNYYFIGPNLYLFGDEQNILSSVVIRDDRWNPIPSSEYAGERYANVIIVKGKTHRGVAEAPQDEIDFTGGRILRRYDRPELETQEAVDRAAEKYLTSSRDCLYLNSDNVAYLTPNLNIDLISLRPGQNVNIDHYTSVWPVRKQMKIRSVEVDCKTGKVGISLVPLTDVLEES